MTDAVKDHATGHREASRHPGWRRYLGAAALGTVTALACFIGTFVLLAQTGNLPPPPIANILCIDEKLSFMRDQPPGQPNFLVVGSSVAWRHIDSSIVEASLPGTVPYNGGFCHLSMVQTMSVTHWLLDRMPTVRHILLLASPLDFESCSRGPATAFDLAEADRFVFQDSWRWEFYFRYFDPVSLARNASRIADLRTKPNGIETLVFTKYGDAPMNPPPRPRLVYDGVESLDPACFQALRALAFELHQAGIGFTVVNTPLNPLWETAFDAGARTRTELTSGIERALDDSGARHWNGDAAFDGGPEAFTDAIHLRWRAAQAFTRLLVENGLSR